LLAIHCMAGNAMRRRQGWLGRAPETLLVPEALSAPPNSLKVIPMTPVQAAACGSLEALIRRSGLSLSPTQLSVIQEGWALVQPMLDRIRGSGRDRTAEPALNFRADAYAAACHPDEHRNADSHDR
jgi:hypothetical protein